MSEISLSDLCAKLRERGHEAVVEDTGGRTATLLAGPVSNDWYKLAVGPGRFTSLRGAVADTEDLYVGPDNDTSDGHMMPVDATFEDVLAAAEAILNA